MNKTLVYISSLFVDNVVAVDIIVFNIYIKVQTFMLKAAAGTSK